MFNKIAVLEKQHRDVEQFQPDLEPGVCEEFFGITLTICLPLYVRSIALQLAIYLQIKMSTACGTVNEVDVIGRAPRETAAAATV